MGRARRSYARVVSKQQSNAAHNSTEPAGPYRTVYNVNGKTDQKPNGKTDHVLNNMRYARIPLTVLRDAELSTSAIAVYGIILFYVYQGSTARIGQRRIAELSGLHQETVGKAIRQLKERRHIAISAVGKQRRLYVLLSPVFSQRQGKQDIIVSAPSGGNRLVSVRKTA